MTRPAAVALGLTGLWIVAVGCRSSEEEVCSAQCDCSHCSRSEHDECLAQLAADARSAARRGCTDAYDDLLSCEDDTARCDGSALQTACGPERDRYDRCVGTDSATCVTGSDCP